MRRTRFHRAMLWVAALVVGIVGLFPSYVGLIAADRATPGVPEVSSETRRVVLPIEGMTCEACTVHVRTQLLEVDGVENASVSYQEGTATVWVRRDAAPSRKDLVMAVERAGYDVPDGQQ